MSRVKKAADPAEAARLLAAVLADPGSDAARLAYAAHLQAAGDARGAYIAAECERAAAPDPRPRQAKRWVPALKALGKAAQWEFRRGFVQALRVNGWDAPVEQVGAVLAAEPVEVLTVEGVDAARASALLALPGVERLQRLTLHGWDAQARTGAFLGQALAGGRPLSALGVLRVGVKLHDAGLLALARAQTLPAVVGLAVGAAEVSDDAFLAFAASPLAQRLEVLEWCRDRITPAMADAVCALPRLLWFSASVGWVQGVEAQLRQRFGERLVIEDEGGMDYLHRVPGVGDR